MLDLGYGLAKMGEGLSAGYLGGTIFNKKQEMKQKQLDATTEYRRGRLGLQEAQNRETVAHNAAMAKQGEDRLKVEKDKVLWDHVGTAFKFGFEALEKTGKPEAFGDISNAFWDKASGKDVPMKFEYDPLKELFTLNTGDEVLVIPKKVGSDIYQASANKPSVFQSLVESGVTPVSTPQGLQPGVIQAFKVKPAPTSQKDTWNAPYQGPDGAMFQKNGAGEVRAVIGRQPQDTNQYIGTDDQGNPLMMGTRSGKIKRPSGAVGPIKAKPAAAKPIDPGMTAVLKALGYDVPTGATSPAIDTAAPAIAAKGRDAAIAILKQYGHPVTEANINYILKQQAGK